MFTEEELKSFKEAAEFDQGDRPGDCYACWGYAVHECTDAEDFECKMCQGTGRMLITIERKLDSVVYLPIHLGKHDGINVVVTWVEKIGDFYRQFAMCYKER